MAGVGTMISLLLSVQYSQLTSGITEPGSDNQKFDSQNRNKMLINVQLIVYLYVRLKIELPKSSEQFPPSAAVMNCAYVCSPSNRTTKSSE